MADAEPRALAALIDTLLPGSERYPSASAAGCLELIERRGREAFGRRFWRQVGEATGDLGPLDAAARTEAVRVFEASRPALFAQLLQAVYLSYYEAPSVAAAIATAHEGYHTRLQPEGHALSPFDPDHPLERPGHARGGYIPTDAVARVERPALPDMAPDLEVRA